MRGGLTIAAWCLVTTSLFTFIAITSSECANACSGHGVCSLFDMCNCYRNWQASDCSERVCLFGKAWADTPLGDLDGDGIISGPDVTTVENSFIYPYGTTEGFPASRDSDGNLLTQSAHGYAECSNAGICNRTSGECNCYDMFDGAACSRMKCPGTVIDDDGNETYVECSGHGVCNNMRQLARYEANDDYKLWDRYKIQGCSCDKGYFGGDCSQRQCGYGLDPLYSDDTSAIKYSVFNFGFLTTSDTIDFFLDSAHKTSPGRWSIKFYDVFEEDWITEDLPSGATCTEVVKALENLPNNVIPKDGLVCYRLDITNRSPLEDVVLGYWNTTKETFYKFHTTNPGVYGPRVEYIIYKPAYWDAGYANSYDVASNSDNTLSGYIYRVEFIGALGYLPQPEILTSIDGSHRRTLHSHGTMFTDVWTNGEQGENYDFIAEHCENVQVEIDKDSNGNYWIAGLTGGEEDVLKQCIGDADDDPTNNVEIDQWDFGDEFHPHLIKLVPSSGEKYNWGFYCIVYYDINFQVFTGGLTTTGTFRVVNPMQAITQVQNAIYDVFASKGTLSLSSKKAEVVFDFASTMLYTLNADYGNLGEDYNGDISCRYKRNGISPDDIYQCVEKGDYIMMFDFNDARNNPTYLNIYKVNKIYSLPETEYIGDSWDACKTRDGNGACTDAITEGMRASTSESFRVHRIETDLKTNWAKDLDENSQFRVYVFKPNPASAYQYVAPCANRGICNHEDGLCECNKGYSGAYCDIQSTIIL